MWKLNLESWLAFIAKARKKEIIFRRLLVCSPSFFLFWLNLKLRLKRLRYPEQDNFALVPPVTPDLQLLRPNQRLPADYLWPLEGPLPVGSKVQLPTMFWLYLYFSLREVYSNDLFFSGLQRLQLEQAFPWPFLILH